MTAKRLIFLSLLVSVIGIGILLIVPNDNHDISTIEQKKSETKRILVANQAIQIGQIYSPNSFRWQETPVMELVDYIDYITTEEMKNIDIQSGIARVAFEKGQVISKSDLVSVKGEDSLSIAVRSGYRAISVPVDQVTANSGLVKPGDSVDILLLASKDGELMKYGNSAQGLYVNTIAYDVRVLAFNRALSRDSDSKAQGTYDAGFPDDSTVSLEVKPEQANQIVLANQLGRLTLSLRGVTDIGKPAAVSKSVTFESISPEAAQVLPDVGLVEFRATDKKVNSKTGAGNNG